MKSVPLLLALLLASLQSLWALSGDGTSGSPYKLGVISDSKQLFLNGLPAGTPPQYYSFEIKHAINVGSTVTMLYAAKPVGYTLKLAKGDSVIDTGTLSFTDSSLSTYRNQVKLTSSLNTGTYKLIIARQGTGSATAPSFNLILAFVTGSVPHPINDSATTPLGIAGFGGIKTGSNVGATKETGEPDHAGKEGGHSVWYAWVAPATGPVTISTAGSDFDTLLAVYKVTPPLPGFQPVASNNNEGDGLKTSALDFTATANVVYYIAVDGLEDATGNFVLSLAEGGTPPGQPKNISPSGNAQQPSNVVLKADPRSSATRSGSQWIVRRSSDGATLLDQYVSGSAAKTTVNGLPVAVPVRWQVRFRDSRGLWSDFSSPTAFIVASVWPPQLSISLVDALAVEEPLHAGKFRITRSNVETALKVKYTVSGKAKNGVDYIKIPSNVTLDAGVATADLLITPLADALAEKKESVTIALAAVKDFKMAQKKATLSIRETLRPQRFAALSGSTLRIDTAGDGEPAEATAVLGEDPEELLIGDFNGTGADDFMARTASTYTLYTSGTGTLPVSQTFTLGTAEDTAFVGDFDGDGRDDLFLRHGKTFSVDTAHKGKKPKKVTFGLATDELVLRSDRARMGDWDGDGRDDLILRRGNLFLVRLSSTGETVKFAFGEGTEPVFLADMDGDGRVEPVLSKEGVYTADTGHDQQTPLAISFGEATETAFAADLDGDGRDELVIQRGGELLIDSAHTGGEPGTTVSFGSEGEAVFPVRVP